MLELDKSKPEKNPCERNWLERSLDMILEVLLIIVAILAIIHFSGCGSSTKTTKTDETVTIQEIDTTLAVPEIRETLPAVLDTIPDTGEPVVIAVKEKKDKPYIKTIYYPKRGTLDIEVKPDSLPVTLKETMIIKKTETIEKEKSLWESLRQTLTWTVLLIIVLLAAGIVVFIIYRFK
jgi:hypothetical protein